MTYTIYKEILFYFRSPPFGSYNSYFIYIFQCYMCTFKDEIHDDGKKKKYTRRAMCGTFLLCLHKLMFHIFQLIQADTCAYIL